jgi:cytochrome c biogenesis protein CcdA/thiol-disulfide isomerase/thioredoxin
LASTVAEFLALAFLGGLVSCASTCILPLVPAYIGYMGGRASMAAADGAFHQQRTVLLNAGLFVAGFSTAFIALGATAGAIGADLKAYRPVLVAIAGVLLVVMGIALLGGLPWLMQERRLDIAHRLPRTPWASYAVGLAFAIGWTPCVGPILTAVLLKAADQATAAEGALLLAAYSAGLGVPFLVAAVLLGRFTRLIGRLRGAYRALNATAAVLMIGMGLLIFSNRLTVLNNYFPYFSPPFTEALSKSALQPNTGGAQPPTPLQPGEAAPAFSLTDLDGRPVSLTDFRGRPVLINFWATWCTPCREELPMIDAAYQAHRDAGLMVVAIDFGDESAETVRAFWKQLHLTPTVALDPNGRVADAYGVGLKTTGLPVSVFVSRDGTISAYRPFALDSDYLEEQLKKIL